MNEENKSECFAIYQRKDNGRYEFIISTDNENTVNIYISEEKKKMREKKSNEEECFMILVGDEYSAYHECVINGVTHRCPINFTYPFNNVFPTFVVLKGEEVNG